MKSFQKSVIFDRDNTLIKDYGYTHKIEHLRWMPGALSMLRRLNNKRFGLFIATNQGGIALGKFSESEMLIFHYEMSYQALQFKIKFIDIMYCKHHQKSKDHKKRYCYCRKPKPGMLMEIIRKHKLNPSQCIYVGDKWADYLCARNAGIKFLSAPKCYGQKFDRDLELKLASK